jgi:transcriptional regulator with XRE-family HTH domain
MEIFAKNAKFLRELYGLTQADMFAVLGVKRSTWNNYEIGLSKPFIDVLVRISKYFGVSETDLLHTDLSKLDKYKNISKDKLPLPLPQPLPVKRNK